MRKVLSLLLTIAICASLFFGTVVYAEGLVFSLKSDKAVYAAGETIAVTIESSNTNYAGGIFEIDYDETKVKYLSTNTAGNTQMLAMPNTEGVPRVALAGTKAQGTTIFTFNFEVLENASGNIVFSLLTSQITDNTSMNVTENYSKGDDLNLRIKSFSVSADVKVGTEIKFDITITDCPDSGVIYAAVYNGSILKACTKETFTTPITTKTLNVEKVNGNMAKVFIWTIDGVPILETPLEKEIDN